MSGSAEWIGKQPGGSSLMDGNGVIHILADEGWAPTKLTADPKLVDMVRQSGANPQFWSISRRPLYLFEDPRLPYEYIAFPRPPEVPQINGLAKAARVFSFLGFLGLVFGPIGLILGYIALGRLRDDDVASRKVARTAIIVGWIITVLLFLLVLRILTQD
jgi:hypothetical protein